MTKSSKLASSSLLFAATVAFLFCSSMMQHEFGHQSGAHAARHDVDFYVYYFGARVLRDQHNGDLYYSDLDSNPQFRNAPEGSPIYQKAQAAGVQGIMLYLYPPLVADLLIPLTTLPPAGAADLWRVMNLALIFLTVFWLSSLLNIRVPSAELLVFVVAAYSFFPIMDGLLVGQVAIAMLALWALSVVAYTKGHVSLSAFALAFASIVKVTPILIIPLFFIWKDRKWLAVYFSTAAGLVVTMGFFNGWHMLGTCVKVLAAMGGSVPSSNNECISSLAAWIYYGKFVEQGYVADPPHLLYSIAKIASILFYGICLFLVWRGRSKQDRTQRAILFALFALVCTLCSPVSWRSAYMVALVPLALLWAQAIQSPRLSLRTVLLAITSIAVGSLPLSLAAESTQFPMMFRLICGSIWTLSSLALCLEVLARGFPPHGRPLVEA